MQGRVVAQDLFNRGVDRIGGEGAGGRVIFQQAGDPVAKRVYRRLVPCIQQQDTRADQRIRAQFFAVFFGGDQLGDQIVTRVLATLIDIAAQEGGEICGGGIGGLFGRAGPADLVDGDHIIGPAQQVGPHILGDAKQPRDDAHGQLGAKSGDQVKGLALGQVGQQGSGDLFDLGGEASNPARGKGTQHQPAQTGVGWRLKLEHRLVFHRIEVAHVIGRGLALVGRGLAAQTAVTQQGLHRRRIKSGHHPVVLPEQHGALRTCARVGGIGVLDEVGIKRGKVQCFHGA